MRTRDMVKMKGMLEQLTRTQRRALTMYLATMEGRDASFDVIEAGVQDEVACPHCGGHHVVKNGTARKLQRFLCRGCQKTFNALTGSPLLHLRKRAHWASFSQAMADGLTLKRASARVGINIKTAFLWRHRFMEAPKSMKAQRLGGVAEADETYFRRSFKGQRQGLPRPSRRRGGEAGKRGLSIAEQVPVLVVCDRSGHAADYILESDDSNHIVENLAPILAKDVILCTEGNSVMMATGRKLGVEHHAVNVAAGVRTDGVWHIQNVNSYHNRLKSWMRQFRGVASKYLDTYLGWFRALDRSPGFVPEPASLLALAIRG